MKKAVRTIGKRLLPGLLLSLTVFLLAPLQLYLTNASECWFTFGQLLPQLLLLGAGLTALSALLLSVLRGAAGRVAEGLVHALTLLLYLQGSWLVISYGTLNGALIDWGALRGRLLLSDGIWLVGLAAAVALALRQKERGVGWLRTAAVLVVLVQAVTLGMTAYTHRDALGDKNPKYLSGKGLREVSAGRNTVVFLLDCFDARLFSHMLEADPSFAEEGLRGFTFYPDTAGGATRTKYAIPFILTGDTNRAERSYRQYLAEAYPASVLIRQLAESGTDAGLYTNRTYVDLAQERVIGNITRGRSEVSSPWGLTGDYLKLVGFRCAPASLHRYFWLYSGDFERWKISGGEGEYALNDPLFARQLRQEGLSLGTADACFRFYHLQGAHDPYTMNEAGESVPAWSVTEAQQAMGCFGIIQDYIGELKRLGVWERTTMLIMADHGNGSYGGVEQNPLLLLRPAGAEAPFAVSDMPFSYASMAQLLSDAVRSGTVSMADYAARGPRYFYVAKEDSVEVSITEYEVTASAWDDAGVKETGRVYRGDTATFTGAYTLGTEISFGLEDTARSHLVSGFYRNEEAGTWTVEKRAELRFVTAMPGAGRLLLKMTWDDTYDGAQRVRVLVNGVPVDAWTADGEGKRECVIPREAMGENAMALVLELPDAHSPESIGIGTDDRELGLLLKTMRLSACP